MNLQGLILLTLKTSNFLGVLALVALSVLQVPPIFPKKAIKSGGAGITQANFSNQKLAVPAIALYLIVSAILYALYPRLNLQARPASTVPSRRAAA